MYVKIRWNKVKKKEDGTIIYCDLKSEIIYDARKVEMEVCPPEKKEMTTKGMVGRMRLLIDIGTPEQEEIFFPWEQPNEVVEVYFMNEKGKTIDRYVY